MKSETDNFLKFFKTKLLCAKGPIDQNAWKEYLSNLPSVYREDIAFRLLLEWHFKLSTSSGNAAVKSHGVENEEEVFSQQIEMISGIGKDIYKLHYQYIEFVFFHARINLENKSLLEIGGCLPNEVLFNEIKIKNYINIESIDYIEAEKGQAYSDQYEKNEKKKTILCNAEEIDQHIEKESMDAIFSVACFEHIHDLPKALNSCYNVLKKGGYLYSYFAPIYSYIETGDHGVIPKHSLLEKKPIGFHLLSMSDQRKKLIEIGINNPKEIQDFLAEVNLNRIPNRLLCEDYIRIITESDFFVLDIQRIEEFNISKRYQSQVYEIRNSNSKISDVMTAGFRVLLKKF